MDEPSFSAIVNRDDPIPVVKVPLRSRSPSPEPSKDPKQSKREALKDKASKLKDKVQDVRQDYRQAQGSGLQERLLNTLIQQIIPEEDEANSAERDYRSRTYVDRPNFSLPTMSTNFRRFNARIGIAFVFQNRLIRLFSWVDPTHTLSFLAIYTLVCLQPPLLPVVPLGLILFFVMIPSFLVRHPPPPTPSDALDADAAAIERYASYGYSGRPVAPPQRVKPAPEMSKDFFRNMRDLQNCMEDFSRGHDAAIQLIMPYTDFSNEKLSTFVFMGIVFLLTIAFVAAHLVPWRAITLIGGWAATAAGHPRVQEVLLSSRSIKSMKDAQERIGGQLNHWLAADIALDDPPEIREVEVFELQRLRTFSASSTDNTSTPGLADGEWEPWVFSSLPHDPMSPARIAGARPLGTQFFEDVQAPRGWRFRDKKWSLDLASRQWVEERCVTGVEIETEGERWVYDIADSVPALTAPKHGKTASTSSKKSFVAPKSWEEGTGSGRKGEWRRRRWVRLVERKVVKMPSSRSDPKATLLTTLDTGVLNPGTVEPRSVR